MDTFSFKVVWISAKGAFGEVQYHITDCGNIGDAIVTVGEDIQKDPAFAGAKEIIISTSMD